MSCHGYHGLTTVVAIWCVQAWPGLGRFHTSRQRRPRHSRQHPRSIPRRWPETVGCAAVEGCQGCWTGRRICAHAGGTGCIGLPHVLPAYRRGAVGSPSYEGGTARWRPAASWGQPTHAVGAGCGGGGAGGAVPSVHVPSLAPGSCHGCMYPAWSLVLICCICVFLVPVCVRRRRTRWRRGRYGSTAMTAPQSEGFQRHGWHCQ